MFPASFHNFTPWKFFSYYRVWTKGVLWLKSKGLSQQPGQWVQVSTSAISSQETNSAFLERKKLSYFSPGQLCALCFLTTWAAYAAEPWTGYLWLAWMDRICRGQIGKSVYDIRSAETQVSIGKQKLLTGNQTGGCSTRGLSPGLSDHSGVWRGLTAGTDSDLIHISTH